MAQSQSIRPLPHADARDITFNKLGICGCGDPVSVLEFVRIALDLLKRRSTTTGDSTSAGDANWRTVSEDIESHFSRGQDGDSPLYWIAWYFIDRAGLIEHGGSVPGSWLTPLGWAYLDYLNEHGTDHDAWPHDE